MKNVEMPTLSTSISLAEGPRLVVIPGGWTAHVPEVERADAETMLLYTRYWQADGLPPARAEARALATVQGALEQGFLRGLQHSIRRYARIYAQRFRTLHREDGTLAGFDPAVMQNAYCPSENVGRRGKAFTDNLMSEMAASAQEEETCV